MSTGNLKAVHRVNLIFKWFIGAIQVLRHIRRQNSGLGKVGNVESCSL